MLKRRKSGLLVTTRCVMKCMKTSRMSWWFWHTRLYQVKVEHWVVNWGENSMNTGILFHLRVLKVCFGIFTFWNLMREFLLYPRLSKTENLLLLCNPNPTKKRSGILKFSPSVFNLLVYHFFHSLYMLQVISFQDQ